MDIREFSNKLAEAAKGMSPEEKASLMKMFETVADEITKVGSGQGNGAVQCGGSVQESKAVQGTGSVQESGAVQGTGSVQESGAAQGTSIPDGITARLQALKENYLTHKPTITTHRARAITKIARENPGMPKIMLRA